VSTTTTCRDGPPNSDSDLRRVGDTDGGILARALNLPRGVVKENGNWYYPAGREGLPRFEPALCGESRARYGSRVPGVRTYRPFGPSTALDSPEADRPSPWAA
jgi:hypothetical protein